MQWLLAGLPTLCLKKVWKFNEVLNVLVTTSHRPAQAPAGNSRVFLVVLWCSLLLQWGCYNVQSSFTFPFIAQSFFTAKSCYWIVIKYLASQNTVSCVWFFCSDTCFKCFHVSICFSSWRIVLVLTLILQQRLVQRTSCLLPCTITNTGYFLSHSDFLLWS